MVGIDGIDHAGAANASAPKPAVTATISALRIVISYV
jgi:hypothetical protein